ncbi:MAG: ABC transporter [Phycisphaerae bacterium]|jgi:ABC-2 type transport system ATP-binding protein|nr:MAG: ABC transporter [Phycisphaerae bacterium]
MNHSPAIQIIQVRHRYGQREVLHGLSVDVTRGTFVALLGPNGSGKSTLFRLICTLIPLQSGQILVDGLDVVRQRDDVRRRLGVLFQSPALDKHLTVRENLQCHGHLYGIRGKSFLERSHDLLERFGLLERADEPVGDLSGGMRRKVELVKVLIPEPDVLLLDEPSTGLDVVARIEFWKILLELRQKTGLTVLLTTHLMDEADRCDRVAIVDQGRLLDHASPETLKSKVGGQVVTLRGSDPEQLEQWIEQNTSTRVFRDGDILRFEHPNAHHWIPQLMDSMPGLIHSISISRPTLEDVFIHLTGRKLDSITQTEPAPDSDTRVIVTA